MTHLFQDCPCILGFRVLILCLLSASTVSTPFLASDAPLSHEWHPSLLQKQFWYPEQVLQTAPLPKNLLGYKQVANPEVFLSSIAQSALPLAVSQLLAVQTAGPVVPERENIPSSPLFGAFFVNFNLVFAR